MISALSDDASTIAFEGFFNANMNLGDTRGIGLYQQRVLASRRTGTGTVLVQFGLQSNGLE